MSLRDYAQNQVGDLDITDLTGVEPWASSASSHTDVNRLRTGKVGAQVFLFSGNNCTRRIECLSLSYSFGRLLLVAQPNTKTPSPKRGSRLTSSIAWSNRIPLRSNSSHQLKVFL